MRKTKGANNDATGEAHAFIPRLRRYPPWCGQTQDYRIGGRCEVCWPKLDEFLVIDYQPAYEISICKARHNCDSALSTDYKPYALISVGEHTDLPHLVF